ncbi:MAG: hypothetical protein K2Y37_20500 [Pirellulales bacterium]|nr:hypothetical protein [Pirellulales bacterium]
MLGAVILFYTFLLAIAVRLSSRPLACAVAWIAARLIAIVPFVIAGMITGGEAGWAFLMYFWHLDLPILLPVIEAITKHSDRLFTAPLSHYLDNLICAFGYLAWYGGGGYAVARWLRSRKSLTSQARQSIG